MVTEDLPASPELAQTLGGYLRSLFRMAKEAGALPHDFDFENVEFYGFGNGVITTENFIPFEVMTLRAFEWDRINFKTQAKKEKICSMLGITMEEL